MASLKTITQVPAIMGAFRECLGAISVFWVTAVSRYHDALLLRYNLAPRRWLKGTHQRFLQFLACEHDRIGFQAACFRRLCNKDGDLPLLYPV